MKKRVLFVFGTRPEAIKMAPLILEGKNSKKFEVGVCITGQHRQMLDQVLQFFEITPDFDLALMKPDQTLSDITSSVLKGVENVIKEFAPDVVMVQGDTTTAMAGALAAFYQKVPVGHVEAGLRSWNNYSPFPEEVNRKIVSSLATYHFAPTEGALQNLKNENHKGNLFVTGNTVIDALLWGVERVKDSTQISSQFPFVEEGRKMILVTAHRRESFGEPFKNICHALALISEEFPDTQIIYPVHLNPNVQGIVYDTLSHKSNIYLIPPVGYPQLIWLLNRSHIVLTDSGGIQEEAPSLGKPVLVLREVTERGEGVDAGTAKLVGTDTHLIVSETRKLMNNKVYYDTMAKAVNPYGEGNSAKTILSLL